MKNSNMKSRPKFPTWNIKKKHSFLIFICGIESRGPPQLGEGGSATVQTDSVVSNSSSYFPCQSSEITVLNITGFHYLWVYIWNQNLHVPFALLVIIRESHSKALSVSWWNMINCSFVPVWCFSRTGEEFHWLRNSCKAGLRSIVIVLHSSGWHCNMCESVDVDGHSVDVDG